MFQTNQNVTLVGITKPVIPECISAEQLVTYCARVSNPKNQANHDTAGKLIKYLIKESHFSPFEMVNLVMEIKTTRDIGRQILRHRSFSFQEFCVSGDSLITTLTASGGSKKIKISDLYKRFKSNQYWNMSNNLVRIFDKKSGKFTSARIKEVFDTGLKPVYLLTLENGKKIKSTKEHKFYTNNGFKDLENLNIDNDFVATNGNLCYRDKDWLLTAKNESINVGVGLSYIAEKAGMKPVTISKWLRKHNLQFTKKEVAEYTKVWNKGLPAELQPNFNKFHSDETRNMMSESAKKGKDSNLYITGNYTKDNLSWRRYVALYCGGYKKKLLIEQNYICPITNKMLTMSNSEVDHKIPVYSNPELAFEYSNLRVICKDAHAEKSQKEALESKYVPSFNKIKSIEYVGVEQTYDMEIDHEDHNYIANGIVTHNSQRYAKATESVLREARLQDTKNRQNSIPTNDEAIQEIFKSLQEMTIKVAVESYQKALDLGIAKEQARALLPEGLTGSTMYMNGTLRSWLHFCMLRMANGTQKEHSEIAALAWDIVVHEFPSLADQEVMTNLREQARELIGK
jgi:thymidylate synthase (FAD)